MVSADGYVLFASPEIIKQGDDLVKFRITTDSDNGFKENCNCEKGDSVMVFIQVQEIGDIYTAQDAFKNGTLFPELNKPFLMGGCLRD